MKSVTRVEQEVWAALADPTRRAMIARLVNGALSISQLTVGAGMTRFGVAKHLGILEEAGLVVSRKHGRLRLFHLNAAGLGPLESVLSPRAQAWGRAAQDFNKSIRSDRMTDPLPVFRVGTIDIALDWEVHAPVEKAWLHFFASPDIWWPRAFRALGGDSRMSFAPRLGASLVEEDSSGAALSWYSVIALQPHKSIDLQGSLAARYGGPTVSLLHVAFVAAPSGETCSVRLTDSLVGKLGPETRNSVTEGWKAIIGEGFVKSVVSVS